MDHLNLRRQLLVKHLKRDGLDALLITNPQNVTYLTGFTGDSSYAVLTQRQCILVSDARFEQQIGEEVSDIEVHIRPHQVTTPEAAAEVLTKTGSRTVGLEPDHATLGLQATLQTLGPKLTFGLSSVRVEPLRMLKDPSEIEQIRQAVRVAEKAYRMFLATLREADTEKDMVDAMEGYVRRAGGRGTSFPPIVAVGERGALPHAPPTDRQLSESSKLLIDWGADCLYKSDITRTIKSPFPVAPKRKSRQERIGFSFDEIYEIVCRAQDAAVEKLWPGVPARDVDAAARKVISDAGYGDYFTHGLGHGIGLDIHEAPRIRVNSDDVIEAGMVVTIEPGIYIPAGPEGKPAGWGGIRIEDDYLVTKDGPVRLTTLPRDPGSIG